jgi:tRNA(fMet)-specific endonuclease VapC
VRYLIDTDVSVDWLVGRISARDLMVRLSNEEVFISAITLMELKEGILGSRNIIQSVNELVAFRQFVNVIEFDAAVAETAASVRHMLRTQKRQIRERVVDIMVAATAIEHNLTLVTRNRKHYDDILGLNLLNDTSIQQ